MGLSSRSVFAWFRTTSSSLIRNLRDREDAYAWRRFVKGYRRQIRKIAHKSGVDWHEAGDVAQEVLVHVAGSIDRFTLMPHPGGFRGWLWRTRPEMRLAASAGEAGPRNDR